MASELDSLLREAGVKSTVPRRHVLQVLIRADGRHLTAEDVFQQLFERDELLGLGSVYRILAEFEAANLVRRVQCEPGKAQFELAARAPHFHFVPAEGRGMVEFMDEALLAQVHALAELRGYRVTDVQLNVFVRPLEQQRGIRPKE